MADQQPNPECAWCGQPATTTAHHGFDYARRRLHACELHASWAKRKNRYMPCIISERFGGLPPEEQAAVVKAAYWSDNITNAEWPVVLKHEDATASNKSRLKKKAAGWLQDRLAQPDARRRGTAAGRRHVPQAD
jgi:hypothetical protein